MLRNSQAGWWVLIVWLLAGNGEAAPTLTVPLATTLADQIVFKTEMKNFLESALTQKLRSGIEVAVEYGVEMYLEKGDRFVAAMSLTHRVVFDSGTKGYWLIRSGEGGRAKVELDREPRGSIMLTASLPLSKFSEKESYYGRVKAVLVPLKDRDIGKLMEGTGERSFLDVLFEVIVGVVAPERYETEWVRAGPFTLGSLK